MWFKDVEEIEREIDSGDVDCRYYRYYKELYLCNIIIVSLNKGGHDLIIPEHVDPYIWKEVGSRDCIVIIEVPPPVHIKDRRTYELILAEGSYVMDMSTPL